jgi:hypothetical protein
MPKNDERQLARKTPVYDHAGRLFHRADREEARELMKRPDVEVIGTATRIKALRFRGPDPALQLTGSHPRRQLGQPHQQESYSNVRRVWTIDRVPERYRSHFQAVVLDRLVKAA